MDIRYAKFTMEEDVAYTKVMQWFFDFPGMDIGLSDLAKQAKISKTTARRVVNRLAKEQFLVLRIFGRNIRISMAQRHPYLSTRKIPYNLNRILGSGILEGVHDRFPNPKAVLLFGSYRKGDDNEQSDIDIAVEVVADAPYRIEGKGIVPQLG